MWQFTIIMSKELSVSFIIIIVTKQNFEKET